MWNFLSSVLEQAGVVALLYVLTLLGAGYAFRALWKAQKEALERLAKVQKEESEKRLEIRKAHDADRARLMEAHATAVKAIRTEHHKELRTALANRAVDATDYAERLDALQERRVTETRDITTKVVQHIASIDTTVGKLGAAVDVLVRVTEQGK